MVKVRKNTVIFTRSTLNDASDLDVTAFYARVSRYVCSTHYMIGLDPTDKTHH